MITEAKFNRLALMVEELYNHTFKLRGNKVEYIGSAEAWADQVASELLEKP